VPTEQALLPGTLTYFTGASHSDLTRDPAVAQAVADLLRHGKTLQLPTRRARPGRAEARISDRQLRLTQVEKVDWSALTPSARRDFLQSLNEPPELTLRVPARTRGALRVPSRSARGRPR
jgi:hypothetical protein